jgi:uncharacterized pyridoxal phosphate-containing UPF0001 family protein
VSKNRSLKEIFPLFEIGHKMFGENKVQEAKQKFTDKIRSDYQINLHLIGPLQTNKATMRSNYFQPFNQLIDQN